MARNFQPVRTTAYIARRCRVGLCFRSSADAFKLVEDASYRPPAGGKGFAICHDDEKVVAGFGGPLIPAGACPASELKNTGATPQLVAHHPAFAAWGVRLLIVGFLLQIPLAWTAVKL